MFKALLHTTQSVFGKRVYKIARKVRNRYCSLAIHMHMSTTQKDKSDLTLDYEMGEWTNARDQTIGVFCFDTYENALNYYNMSALTDKIIYECKFAGEMIVPGQVACINGDSYKDIALDSIDAGYGDSREGLVQYLREGDHGQPSAEQKSHRRALLLGVLSPPPGTILVKSVKPVKIVRKQE